MDVVDDALRQPIELGALGRGKGGGAGDRSEESRGEGGVDALEEFQEDEADGVACLREAIASSVRELLDQGLGAELREVVAERRQPIGGARRTKGGDGAAIECGPGKGAT